MHFPDPSKAHRTQESSTFDPATVLAEVSRRRFAGSLAAMTLCAAAKVQAEQPGTDPAAGKPEDLSVADWETVQARHRNSVRVYGARLSAEQRGRLLHVLTRNQQMLASIRSFTLQNGDAGACTLRLVTDDGTVAPGQ